MFIEVLRVSQGGGIYAAPTERRHCCRRGRGYERSWFLKEAELIACSALLVVLLDHMPEGVLDLLLHLDDVAAVDLGNLVDQ